MDECSDCGAAGWAPCDKRCPRELERERDEARAVVAAQAADLMNATTRERQYQERVDELEADNAKLRAEVETLRLRHLPDYVRALEIGADESDVEVAQLRARVALAEAFIAEIRRIMTQVTDAAVLEQLQEAVDQAESSS